MQRISLKELSYNKSMPMKDYKRHGGPYDRGSADYYYGRRYQPHYYMSATHKSPRVGEYSMTQEEIEAYSDGYQAAKEQGDQKNYA